MTGEHFEVLEEPTVAPSSSLEWHQVDALLEKLHGRGVQAYLVVCLNELLTEDFFRGRIDVLSNRAAIALRMETRNSVDARGVKSDRGIGGEALGCCPHTIDRDERANCSVDLLLARGVRRGVLATEQALACLPHEVLVGSIVADCVDEARETAWVK